MRREANLEHYELYILFKAREMANVDADIEDFQQEGRIAAWKALRTQQNRSGQVIYIRNMIDWRMTDYQRKLYKVGEKEVVGFTPSENNLLYGNTGVDNENEMR